MKKRLETQQIPPPEKPFEVVCIKCVRESIKKQIPYIGAVNHNYRIIALDKMVIEYRCFNCAEEYTLPIDCNNPNQQEPTSKKDFEKKAGFREEKIIN